MTASTGQLVQTQDLQPLLDAVVTAGAPGVLARVQTPTDTLSSVSGVANRNSNAPMTPDLHFRVGSITKTFIAAIILQLAGEGQLKLDDQVGRWLPWLPRLLPPGEAITVRQLLNHTSGLFNYTEDPLWLLAALTGKSFRPEELVLVAALRPLNFAPGTDWSYSNTNYIVAGLIIEKVTGQSVEDQLRTRIFQRLELHRTSYPNSTRMSDPHTRGYAFIKGLPYLDVTTTVHSSAYGAAGAIISNADDLATFYQALLSGTLLRPALLEVMKTTVIDAQGNDTGYGLGLSRVTISCGVMWGHGGAVAGYFTPMALASADGTRSGVLMTNVMPWPAPALEPLNQAAAAIICQALLGQVPVTAVAEATRLEYVVPIFDEWSALVDIVKQTHRATLNLNLLNVAQDLLNVARDERS